MKKTLVMLVGLAVAGAAVADIAVDFKSGGVPILKAGEVAPGPTTVLNPGSLVQLVWRADNANYQVGRTMAGTTDLGDVVLFSGVAGQGGIWALGVQNGTDAQVGAAVDSGYIFARIFETTGVAGDSVLEMGIQAPTLKTFSATDPLSVYSENMNNLGIAAIDSQGISVIPEPATFGLMAVAGLGMFLARRKARR